MRTITADWSLSGDRKRADWLSNVGARFQRAGSAWAARRRPTREALALSGRQSHDPFVQADVAAFVSAFMRIG
jgi:hypothetical protein